MPLFGRLFSRLRRKPQQAVLAEDEAYARCHGSRAGDVRIVATPRAQPRLLPRLGGDYLRRRFEERLEARRTAHT